MLADSGSASAPIHYDPWGTPTQGTPPTFGFTGELQEATSGLVQLRVRWYLPGHGTFGSRDPFAGFPTQPYSLHPYQYAYSNPVLYTDPSGKNPCWVLGWEDCGFLGWNPWNWNWKNGGEYASYFINPERAYRNILMFYPFFVAYDTITFS